MIHCDTLIKNGNICDGTGNEVYVSDIAIKNGVIIAVGPNLQTSHDELIDATGLLVTPGFVDVHTHYDGQITWDPYCSPSTQHGVTTLMFGNCGVGFAPCRPEDRSKLIGLLEGVEDIPGTALHEGMEFKWETFPEYMDFLSKQETACDFLAMACHVPEPIRKHGRTRASRGADDLTGEAPTRRAHCVVHPPSFCPKARPPPTGRQPLGPSWPYLALPLGS